MYFNTSPLSTSKLMYNSFLFCQYESNALSLPYPTRMAFLLLIQCQRGTELALPCGCCGTSVAPIHSPLL